MKITLDEGFQFGLGAFETIAVEAGKPIFLDKHLKRLERAAEFLHLGMLSERGITEKQILRYLEEQAQLSGSRGNFANITQLSESRGNFANMTQLPESRENLANMMQLSESRENFSDITHCALKIMLSKENVVFSMRANPYTPERYEKGFVLDISPVKRNETSSLVYHKTMNYGDCILEKRNAAAAGVDERLFLNTKDQICEGTVSNIFFVKQGKLYTPEVRCGLLPGILREYICETQHVEETTIYPENLKAYEECFVTNSLMGIMPVRQVGEISFTEEKVTQALMAKYQKLIANDVLFSK